MTCKIAVFSSSGCIPHHSSARRSRPNDHCLALSSSIFKAWIWVDGLIFGFLCWAPNQMAEAMLLKNTLNLARHSIHLPRIPLRRQVSPAGATQPAAGVAGLNKVLLRNFCEAHLALPSQQCVSGWDAAAEE